MNVRDFVGTLRTSGSVRVDNVTLSRPLFDHQDQTLNEQPLLVMESMLNGESQIVAAWQETKGTSQHTYYIVTDGGSILRVAARLVKKGRGVSVRVSASSYEVGALRELAFEADCANGPQRASARLDFGQAKPIRITASAPDTAKALQKFVGVLCTLGRSTEQGRGA